ncbi:LysR family transcriptional regulator [Curvivirga sp.]|uniref:LysR family transcriptional regulator n=1 Tax=Curvivirga sp. TaxID=2856848 RepID=UPI003B5BFD13
MIFNDLALFMTVARCQSFSKAAEELNITPSRMSRRIADLEQQLGNKLFERTTRQVRLTEEGRLLLDRCQAPIEELEELSGGLNLTQAQNIRMTAPSLAARVTIAPKLLKYMVAHPLIKIELISSNQYLDFVRDNIDLAFRIGPLADENLIAKKLWPISFSFCASDDLIHEYGLTLELDREQFLALPAIAHRSGWRISGEGIFHPPSTVHSFDDLEMIQMTTSKGLGVSLLPDDMVTGNLKKLSIRQMIPETREMFVVYPSRRLLPQRIRDFIDFISK